MARNKKSANRVRNYVLMCSLFGILLIVGTYAWFIGMQSVAVSAFDVKIAAAEGLSLSLDGAEWYEGDNELDVSTAKVYAGNTNTWAKDGLIPMSSVGDTDINSSRMILFEKGSLTATKGGYRLLASRVKNYTKIGTSDVLNQGEGYVAFDLFIRNKSGEEYYSTNNPLNEEAIYLTTGSKVTVAAAGASGSDEGGIAGTGIENSVRVGFMQVGRVEQDGATQDQITSITCKDVTTEIDGEDVVTSTGICRTATIWEPNDTLHVANAIKWYNESCNKRTGVTVSDDKSYTADACKAIVNGTADNTYAVANELKVGSNVDVYDGAEYNYYDDTYVTAAEYFKDGADKSTAKLVEMDYFTDTEKMYEGVARPTFMTLAPNSVTKVRVYIWIEGQDVDNYDFSSLGKQISVNFGFTKERFDQDEIIVPNTPVAG